MENSLRFVPSDVEGISGVSEAIVFPDRLELSIGGNQVVYRFIDIARWFRHGWYYRLLARLGFGVRGWPSVADRDWFHPPNRRYFQFYTNPKITLYMPDEPEIGYGETTFRRIQDVMGEGGFGTFDLG